MTDEQPDRLQDDLLGDRADNLARLVAHGSLTLATVSERAFQEWRNG